MLQSGNEPVTECFQSDQKEKNSCVGFARKKCLEKQGPGEGIWQRLWQVFSQIAKRVLAPERLADGQCVIRNGPGLLRIARVVAVVSKPLSAEPKAREIRLRPGDQSDVRVSA